MKKVISLVSAFMFGTIVGGTVARYIVGNQLKQSKKKVNKFKGYYLMINQWLALKQESKNLKEYFEKQGYHNIAIYGMGEMGNRLYDELRDSNINVKYAIDEMAVSNYPELKMVDLEEGLEAVDAIIVTAVFAYDEIEAKLSQVTDCPIVSLEDIVCEIE